MKIRFKYEVLFLFVVLEVLFYNASGSLQLIAAVCEYLFVLYALIADRDMGIMYFVSFSILALGQETHIIYEVLPSTFWGIRAFGFSFNILFAVLVFAYSLLTSKIKYFSVLKKPNTLFFSVFITYSFIIGIISVAYFLNYFDNFLKDLMSYLPYFIYVYIISLLGYDSILKIVKYCLSLSVITMMLSVITNNKFDYGGGNYYALCGSFIFIIPVAILFSKDLYDNWQYLLLLSSIAFLLLSGNFFIGGKFIVILFIAFLWLGLTSKKFFILILGLFISLLYFIEPVFLYVIEYFQGGVISYKFSQILDVYIKMNIYSMAETKTSMGNLFAEGITIYNYIMENNFIMMIGRGFGGGVKDIFGYLFPFVGPGAGYNIQDALRNDYFRMHLPIFEIILKSGILGLSFYLSVLTKIFFTRNKFSLIYFLLLFTVFYISKELLLLTLIFMRLSINPSS